MIELAKGEGESYSRFARAVSGFELEQELSYVSKKWLREDLLHGWANILDCSFDPTQRRLLFYILHKMIVEYLRANRRNIAEANVFRDEREQGLA